jgi:hypothetical protein
VYHDNDLKTHKFTEKNVDDKKKKIAQYDNFFSAPLNSRPATTIFMPFQTAHRYVNHQKSVVNYFDPREDDRSGISGRFNSRIILFYVTALEL